MSFRTLHLFAGIGGGLLANVILDHTPIGAIENSPYCCQILRERASDGWFPELQVHECDIREFDFSIYCGKVAQISAGWPCQDISAAGRGSGITGERSGLVSEVWRAIDAVRPAFVFLENSPLIRTRGRDVVWRELQRRGYVVVDGTIAASDVGALHIRKRWFCLAANVDRFGDEWWPDNSRRYEHHGRNSGREEDTGRAEECFENAADTDRATIREQLRWRCGESWKSAPEFGRDAQNFTDVDVLGRDRRTWDESKPERWKEFEDVSADTLCDRLQIAVQSGGLSEADATAIQAASGYCGQYGWNPPDACVLGMVHGVSHKMESIKGLGNAQVPLQAALAWVLLYRKLITKEIKNDEL